MTKMKQDSQYIDNSYSPSEIKHLYGQRVHLLSHPAMQSLLGRLCRPETVLPEISSLVERLYEFLILEAINTSLPQEIVQWDTRMRSSTEAGVFRGSVISSQSRAIIVDLARAGAWPSHICFHRLHDFLHHEGLRQDHFYLNRKTNEKNEVIGVDVSGSKIGGDQENAYVFFPDPMGATGGSLSHCISHYKNNVQGKALKYMALHLIVTPEYIRRMKKDHPDVEIFALRLDRGLSPEDILKTVPGTYEDREKGLNEVHYIVPGAGGVGEILNNSFV